MARILIIDDDPAICRTFERMLVREGHEVESSPDGADALARIAASEPDLVITDIYMPEMDGIEFLLKLRQTHDTLPVIAISGGGSAPAHFVLEDAERLGANAILAKPFDIPQVLDAVRVALSDSSAA